MGSYIGRAKASRPREGFIANPKLKLLEQVGEVMRFKHYSIRTETRYREWIRRLILFQGKRHSREMGAAEVERLLSDLAVRRKVAASTQNHAFKALGFLYRDVLLSLVAWLFRSWNALWTVQPTLAILGSVPASGLTVILRNLLLQQEIKSKRQGRLPGSSNP